MKNILIVLFLVLSLVVGIIVWPEELTEEERVEQVIHHIRDGIEQEVLADVMEGFSKSYKDDAGGSYEMIKGLFMRQFLKSDPITIQLSPMKIDVQQNTAEANFDAAIFEGEGVSIFALPNNSDELNFSVQLTKDTEGEWRITSHTREFNADQ